jgi:O-antigen ligase
MAGGHNEYLQSLMRMGIVGLLSRLLLLFLPLVVFVGATRSGDPVRARNGFLGLFVVVAYLVTGLSQEVFNLSYSASLYALLVSTFAAGALPQPVLAAQAPRTAPQGGGSRAYLT